MPHVIKLSEILLYYSPSTTPPFGHPSEEGNLVTDSLIPLLGGVATRSVDGVVGSM